MTMDIENELTEREKIFCKEIQKCFDPKGAAAIAGYPPDITIEECVSLLMDSRIIAYQQYLMKMSPLLISTLDDPDTEDGDKIIALEKYAELQNYKICPEVIAAAKEKVRRNNLKKR